MGCACLLACCMLTTSWFVSCLCLICAYNPGTDMMCVGLVLAVTTTTDGGACSLFGFFFPPLLVRCVLVWFTKVVFLVFRYRPVRTGPSGVFSPALPPFPLPASLFLTASTEPLCRSAGDRGGFYIGFGPLNFKTCSAGKYYFEPAQGWGVGWQPQRRTLLLYGDMICW